MTEKEVPTEPCSHYPPPVEVKQVNLSFVDATSVFDLVKLQANLSELNGCAASCSSGWLEASEVACLAA